MQAPMHTDMLANFARREYYFVKAIRPMSDGTPRHGFAKGFMWEHGFSGPHTLKEARRCAAIWGGEIITMADGLKALDAIKVKVEDKEAPSHRGTHLVDDESVDDELVLAAAEEVEKRADLPPFEEMEYWTAVNLMSEAGFNWESIGGGRKKSNVAKAWEIFRQGSTT